MDSSHKNKPEVIEDLLPGKRMRLRTFLSDGKIVSTVSLCFDGFPLHDLNSYETMVFESEESGNDLDCMRYATKDRARAGHLAMVVEWEEKISMERS